ncbi:MAG TPA: hypothetical protein VG651_17740 [Stellaceae bacterium]|nr:hypothetical protein [Stellaceae bacterium]
MGAMKSWAMEHGGRDDVLQQLLDPGEIDGAAAGITKLVIDRGEAALSPRQKEVYQRYVLDRLIPNECKYCGSNIPWSEVMQARETGNCGWCDHFLNKDD